MNKTILIVEDDENDRLFHSLAFDHIHFRQHIQFVTDGQEAIDYLLGMHHFSERAKFPLPRVVLLDLHLPVLPGLEVLRWIRSRKRFNSTIVIPLTSSSSPLDIEATHAAGANDYLVKPFHFHGWSELASRVVSTWLLPPVPSHQPEWGALHHVPA